MVGVLPCSDPAEASHLEASVLGGVTYSADPVTVGAADSSILNSSNLNTTKPIRSLTQSYKSAQNELDVSWAPHLQDFYYFSFHENSLMSKARLGFWGIDNSVSF